MIERHPLEGRGLEIETIGDIMSMIRLGPNSTAISGQIRIGLPVDHDLFKRSANLVAGTRNRLDLLLVS
ncbi:MAG: hypothetical protein ACRYG8_44865 [Janthinobacterium lividum]